MDKTIKNHLKELGFSENEIRVYIALTGLGESTAATIAKKAGLARTTAISILEKMAREHYVSQHTHRGTNYYWIESPSVLREKFENRAKIADELSLLLREAYRSESDFPYGEIYDTKESIKSFFEKTIIKLPKNSTIYTIDTPKMGNYEKIYSDDFRKHLFLTKKKKGVLTKTLVPYGSFAGISEYKLKYQTIIIREMPEEIKFRASLWIICDRVVQFSGKYPFVSVVRHSIIAYGIKSIFDYIWERSNSMN